MPTQTSAIETRTQGINVPHTDRDAASGDLGRANARIEALTVRERARLTRILARLASPYEGERAAAGLLASAFVAKHGLTWADLTAFLQPRPEAPMSPKEAQPKQERRRSGKGWRGFCRRRIAQLGQSLDRLT